MRRTLLAACALAALLALPAFAATLGVTLPTVTGSPGQLVSLPITVASAPAPFGIYSIDFKLTLGTAYFASSASSADGFLQAWGPPTVNATAAALAAAAAGTSPVTTSGTLLNTVVVRLKPTVAVGTVIPLAFQHITFNGGDPAAVVTNGSITVVAPPASADAPAPGALALAVLENPARSAARFAVSVPAGGAGARLAVYALDGRRVAALAAGPGARTLAWDLRGTGGARVAPGLYFARLSLGGRAVVRRLVVAP